MSRYFDVAGRDTEEKGTSAVQARDGRDLNDDDEDDEGVEETINVDEAVSSFGMVWCMPTWIRQFILKKIRLILEGENSDRLKRKREREQQKIKRDRVAQEIKRQDAAIDALIQRQLNSEKDIAQFQGQIKASIREGNGKVPETHKVRVDGYLTSMMQTQARVDAIQIELRAREKALEKYRARELKSSLKRDEERLEKYFNEAGYSNVDSKEQEEQQQDEKEFNLPAGFALGLDSLGKDRQHDRDALLSGMISSVKEQIKSESAKDEMEREKELVNHLRLQAQYKTAQEQAILKGIPTPLSTSTSASAPEGYPHANRTIGIEDLSEA